MFIILDAFRVVRLAFHLRVVFSAFLISIKRRKWTACSRFFLDRVYGWVCMPHNAYNIWWK